MQLTKHHAPAVALLLAVATFFVHAALPLQRWSTHLPPGDAETATYHIRWGHEVLWSEPWRYFSLPLFEPQPTPRFFTETNAFLAFCTRPLSWFADPAFCYHAVMWCAIALTTLGAYGALHSLTGHRRASILGALCFGVSADQMYHLWGHPNVASPVALLPAMALLAKLREGGRWSTGGVVLLAALFFVQSQCSFYLAVMLAAACTMWWGADFVRTRFRLRSGADAAIGVGIAAGLVAIYVGALPYRDFRSRIGEVRGLHEASVYSASLSGYFTPTHIPGAPSPWLGERIAAARTVPERIENAQFPGYVPLALAALLLIRWRRLGRRERAILLPLGVVATAGFVFSFGPFLWWNDRVTGIKLPWYWMYQWIDPIRFMRATSRWSILPGAFVAACVAMSLARAAWFNTGSIRARLAWLLAGLAVLTVEFRPARPIEEHPVDPRGREALAKHPELRRIGSIPVIHRQFLYDGTATFPVTPSGTFDGVYNGHFQLVVATFNARDFEGQLALLRALAMDAVAVYGAERLAEADASPHLQRIEAWKGGALYRLAMPENPAVLDAKRALGLLTEKPTGAPRADFPPGAIRWQPTNWHVLDDEPSPPHWTPIPWRKMGDEGFEVRKLSEKFYAGFPPVPGRNLTRVFVRYRIEDPGVTYGRARLWWLAEGESGWNSRCYVDTWTHPDGEWHTMEFYLPAAPGYDRDRLIGALQLEPSITPWPGQRIHLSEIRFLPE